MHRNEGSRVRVYGLVVPSTINEGAQVPWYATPLGGFAYDRSASFLPQGIVHHALCPVHSPTDDRGGKSEL